MPLLLHCCDLQPQMRLAEAFRWQGRTMLPGGKVLTADDVAILRRRYPDVTLRIGDPILDAVVQFEDDSRDAEVAAEAQARVAGTLAAVQERFASRASIASVNFQAISDAAASVIDYLKANPVSAALLCRQSTPDNYLSSHSGAVFYLCIVLGSAIRDYVAKERRRQTSATNLSPTLAIDLTPLGLGAMLMDIAMYSMPQVFTPGYELTESDRLLIRQHPVASAEMLPDFLPGYPQAAPGRELHVFTRIVRICDAFVAVTNDRLHRQAKSPARALWEMQRGPSARCYDPVLMKVFHSLIQPFPIGSKIKLTDGRYGVVIRYNRRDSFRPQLIVAFNADGSRVPNESLGQPFYVGEGQHADLRLARFGNEDLSYLHDPAVPTGTTAAPLVQWEAITNPLETFYP